VIETVSPESKIDMKVTIIQEQQQEEQCHFQYCGEVGKLCDWRIYCASLHAESVMLHASNVMSNEKRKVMYGKLIQEKYGKLGKGNHHQIPHCVT